MDALVVASHLPGEGHFESERFRILPVLCAGSYDYWQGLASVWDHPGPLVNVEHDLEATDEHVRALIDCPEPLCSWAYVCHWRSTGLPFDVIAAGTGARDPGSHPDPGYLLGGEVWAAWSALGLVKIGPEARVGPLSRERWQQLELAVHDAVIGPWHMHGNEAGGASLLPHHHW